MIQLAILPGPNSPKILDSFLRPIVEEFKDLSNHGLVIRRHGNVICKSKINLVIATGDIPAAASLAHNSGHMSTNDITASLREKTDFTSGRFDLEKGINIEPLFTSLPTFTHPTFFALEELHLIGQGIAKHVFELLTVLMKKTYNKAIALRYAPTEGELEEENITSAIDLHFTFGISKDKLIKIGNFIKLSRPTVPTTFSSKWENPIEQSVGNRGVDWIDFLVYMVPTAFVPALLHNNVKKPLLVLCKPCAVALKWRITREDLPMIKSAFNQWNTFFLNERRQKQIQPGVLKSVQHYLTHVPMMIEKQGSKVNAGANAGNVLERFAIYGHVNSLNTNLRETLNLLEPKKRTTNDFVSLDPSDDTTPELWSPLFQCPVSTLPCGVL
ncbi:hypothetical protein INT47_005258 [Mucor saturninus]|uniref:Uncharacterized protein n=1 Tax=Mucor saturninus TaxID=64648 RepID=A0A8H7R4U4_9FUNG|nr:hypothetical protein INT47_005258 [Mucor saturninus]